MLSSDSSFADIEASPREGAVFAIGANEQHGRHLGLCTDTVIGGALAQKIAEAFDWYLLPPLPFGTSLEHIDFPGTVTLSAATLAAVVREVAASLRRQGFRNLVIVSGHGGNWILKPTVREINLEFPQGPRVLLVDTEVFYYPLVDRPGFHHGGEYETAMMLYLRSQAVQMERAAGAGAEPDLPRAMLDCVSLRKVLPGGAWGAPEKATLEMGRSLFERAAGYCVEYTRSMLKSLDAVNQNDSPKKS
jgi:creatinine amidohydrolase